MIRRDFVQIGAWAGATAIVAVMVIGGSGVKSDSRIPNGPAVLRIAGNELAATARPGAQPETVAVHLEIANPGSSKTANTFLVTIVKDDFAGSPMSRVPTRTDYSRQPVSSTLLSANLNPGQTINHTITLTRTQLAPKVVPLHGPSGAAPATIITSSYEVEVTYGSTVHQATAFPGQILEAKGNALPTVSLQTIPTVSAPPQPTVFPQSQAVNGGSSSAPYGIPAEGTHS